MTDETIFAEALNLTDPPTREAYLAGACGNDADRRRRLAALLAAADRAGDFLRRPAIAPAATTEALGEPAGEFSLDFLQPTTRPDSLGRIGHYEVLQVLGQGSFGIVFRALDDILQRVVAVKVLSPQLAATSPARKRFLREARTLAIVRHESVVQVFEVGETPLPYIAMEYIPGETLQQRLDRSGPIEVAEIVRIGRQIAEGLAAAHANDLIHRDIKPANILLEGGQHRVKITDFGLARAADDASISQSGIIVGSPMYMAPEQALGRILDQRADLFSLGSVLYQMAAGRPPFRANTVLAVLKRVAEDTPRPIRESIPETPQWLCDIIAKLHAKTPAERYQSAREVADVLADCETQLQANAKLRDFTRIPKSVATQRPPRRWRIGLILTAMVFIPGFLALLAIFGTISAKYGLDNAARYASNQYELELLLGEPSIAEVTIEKDGWVIERVGSVTTRRALQAGDYRFRVAMRPGYQIDKVKVIRYDTADVSPESWSAPMLNDEHGDYFPLTLDRGTRVQLAFVVSKIRTEPSEWTPLFNGKNLSGWLDQGGYWKIENGLLVSRVPNDATPESKLLSTVRDDYHHFHVRLEAKINDLGDSGLFFRSGGSRGRAIQAQILGSGNSFGSLLWDTTTLVPAECSVKPDEWFAMDVVAQGSKIVVRVNGNEVVNWVDPDGPRRGPISLETGFPKTQLTVRKIEIQELPPKPATPKPNGE